MFSTLSGLPLWRLVAVVMILPTVVAVLLQWQVRRFFGYERLKPNNEVAGFQFAIVGVIYAVLLAFVVIAVWEKFSEGQKGVAQEAGAAAALFHYADGPEPEAAKLRHALEVYLERVIHGEWPAMDAGTEDAGATHALNDLYQAAMALNRTGTRTVADMSEVFTQIDTLTSARRIRLHLSTGLVPDVIWLALFVGAGLTVVYTFFFGTQSGLAQLAMTAILSLLVTLGLFVIVALNRPFSGAVRIEPESLEHVLVSFEQK